MERTSSEIGKAYRYEKLETGLASVNGLSVGTGRFPTVALELESVGFLILYLRIGNSKKMSIVD